MESAGAGSGNKKEVCFAHRGQVRVRGREGRFRNGGRKNNPGRKEKMSSGKREEDKARL
jgi:hypothetical protein